jgi:RNA polymerase sigma factor (sigma-70 family)
VKKPLADEALLDLFVQTHKPVYFELLYHRHQPIVVQFCTQYVNDPNDAHDLAQDSFIRLFKQAGTFKGQARFQTWLLTIARNTCIDYLRRRKTRQFVYCDAELIAKATHRDEAAEADTLHYRLATLEKALDNLPTDDALLLISHYQEQIPIGDIAQQQQVSKSAVKMRLLRARTRLRQAYSQQAAPLF